VVCGIFLFLIVINLELSFFWNAGLDLCGLGDTIHSTYDSKIHLINKKNKIQKGLIQKSRVKAGRMATSKWRFVERVACHPPKFRIHWIILSPDCRDSVPCITWNGTH
jgi:hypothetical protein